jgi:hypothetical protein
MNNKLSVIIAILLFFFTYISVASEKDNNLDMKPVDITLFGAEANDGLDDTKALAEALKISGIVTIPKGIYHIKELVRNGKTIIYGNGSTFVSELDTTNNGRTSKNILTLSGNKIEIKNLLLDGAYTNGDAKEGENISSLLHIYDSQNILLDGVDTINHSSNWWSSKRFNFSNLNDNHKIDMYHAIYIGFSNNIVIKNMEQRGNIKTEGLLIYESDNIDIDGFISSNSPNIWTSMHIIASDNINMNNIDISDGVLNQSGSSVNFIGNHHFKLKNLKIVNKQGFDISNEIKIEGISGRVTRDTSYGVFENCYFKGQRALHGYPTIQKNKDLLFKNTEFIPTKEGYETWGIRVQSAGNIKFENCIFGNKKFKTYGIIMGNSKEITVKNSKFINPSIGIYIYGDKFGKVNVINNTFSGKNYTPVSFNGNHKGNLKEFKFINNSFNGKLNNSKKYIIMKNFYIEKNIN